MHVWLQRYFLPDVVLHVPLAEQKGLSRWRKCEVPGRVGDGVIPVPAVLLTPAVLIHAVVVSFAVHTAFG